MPISKELDLTVHYECVTPKELPHFMLLIFGKFTAANVRICDLGQLDTEQ
jgi:hypothetical protein